MLAQDAGNVLTQEFLNDALRQGCAFDFDELKPLEKEKTLLQCKDPKNTMVKYFLNEIVKPTQLRNIIFGKQLRNKKFDDLLKTRLDNPQFQTAVARLFAMDFHARGPYAKGSQGYNDMVAAITEFLSVFRKTYTSEQAWVTSSVPHMKTMFAIAFGSGEFCGAPCGQAHIDIFKGDECKVGGPATKFRSSDRHSIAQMKYLVSHFNSNLVSGEGCLICVTTSGDRKTDIPDKGVVLDGSEAISNQFELLQKHCKNHHTMQLDFNHGLALLYYPNELGRKIQVHYSKVCTALASIAPFNGIAANTGCELSFTNCLVELPMRVCGTAQQKLKGYIFYSPHFFTSADHNFAEQPRLYNFMKAKTNVGQKFTEIDQIDIPTERETLRKALELLVSVEETKAKTMKEDLAVEKEKRVEAEKAKAVAEAKAEGHVATIAANKEASDERKQKADRDDATAKDIREKQHTLNLEASKTRKVEAESVQGQLALLGTALRQNESF